MEQPWRLCALVPIPAEALNVFTGDLAFDVVVPEERTQEAARAAAVDADIVLGDYSWHLRVDAELVAGAKRLAFVQQPSVGVDVVDLAACAAGGVPVANTAGANAVSVAEWTVMAALVMCRSALWADAEVRAGRWPQLDLATRGCVDLAGRRVGFVGHGRIAVEAARRFAAFGCPVAYWSRTPRPHGAGLGEWRELDDLVATSDVLVVAVALADETRGLLDAARLARLPRGALVVDVSRGGIVEQEALLPLLDTGALSGAALDVFAAEPLPAESPLRAHDRVMLSPHAAGATLDARLRIVAAVAANLRRAVSGEPVHDVCNGVDPLVRRRT